MTRSEQLAQYFLDYFYSSRYRDTEYIKRMAICAPPLAEKICQLDPSAGLRRTRQGGWHYRNFTFKIRFRHEGGGCIEIVETTGNKDLAVVSTITSLAEAVNLDLRRTLDAWLGQDPLPLAS
jgi:hypothetical protein